MLCPFCLADVNEFPARKVDRGQIYSCPACHMAIPLRYVQDYWSYPPVILSLIGLPRHGKTTYLATVLHGLIQLVSASPSFTYTALDEEAMELIREKQRALDSGHLPESTPQVFPHPVILRMEGDPIIGQCHLLIYDTGGEVFTRVSAIKQYAGYIMRSSTVVWLLSIQDLEHPSDLDAFLTRYVQAVLENGGDPKAQRLLVTLTKADSLAMRADAPDILREFLLLDDAPAIAGERWQAMSAALDAWLRQQPGFANFVKRSQKEFLAVDFTAVSALGATPKGAELMVAVQPRRVLSPLYAVAVPAIQEFQQARLAHEQREAAERDAQKRRDEQQRVQQLQEKKKRMEARQREEAALARQAREKTITKVTAGIMSLPLLAGSLWLFWSVLSRYWDSTNSLGNAGLVIWALLGVFFSPIAGIGLMNDHSTSNFKLWRKMLGGILLTIGIPAVAYFTPYTFFGWLGWLVGGVVVMGAGMGILLAE